MIAKKKKKKEKKSTTSTTTTNNNAYFCLKINYTNNLLLNLSLKPSSCGDVVIHHLPGELCFSKNSKKIFKKILP